jgi:hypothetical protein
MSPASVILDVVDSSPKLSPAFAFSLATSLSPIAGAVAHMSPGVVVASCRRPATALAILLEVE